MECNKEEAVRAKELAEKMMTSKDFPGARKIALRAQRLYHDLENISQMLMVCDVHCASEKKIFGNESDWYGILQIEQTADEATIRKQYRKFALLLHPDKNKFPGAEAAFKLIGEAQRVLLDQTKRVAYDMKRRVNLSRPAAFQQSQRSSGNPHATAQANIYTKVSVPNSQQKQPQQQSQPPWSNGKPTFWTKCPFCTVRYQYYTDILHRTLRCQTCDKSFIAYDLGAAPQATSQSQPKVPQQKEAQNQGARKVEPVFPGKFGAGNFKVASSSKAARASHVGAENVNGNRGKKESGESSESCDTQSSSDSDEDILIGESTDAQAGKGSGCRGESLRRSGRRKQEVSYKENLSDDEDLVSPLKRAKVSGSSNATDENGDIPKEEASKMNSQSGPEKVMEQMEGARSQGSFADEKKETEKSFNKETAEEGNPKKCSEAFGDGGKKNSSADFETNSSPSSTQEPEVHLYPDPDFNDFDKGRKEGSFSVGQIWAVYDTLDAMPRFYARIRKVLSPGFKLSMTWLEPDPDNEIEIKWVEEGLPASSGKFNYGDTEITEDRLMFSHPICWKKGIARDAFHIHPLKGETWALFKNWDIKWNSDAGTKKKFEYEFVEILSHFDEDEGGILVAYLYKVKGFVSVFSRRLDDGIGAFKIPPSELLRFSHRVPSFKLSGKERTGVPIGSFELDPASLPTNLETSNVPEESRSCFSEKVEQKMSSGKTASSTSEKNGSSPASPQERIEYPESEFYSFDDERSQEKFQVGQFWSLYSDDDGLPKYYGQIVKVETNPAFKLHLKWLAAIRSSTMVQWHDKEMPSGCGRFRLKVNSSQEYSVTSPFSHQLKAVNDGRKNVYVIFPRKGEVWALYRNWNSHIEPSDLENWEYDFVEVMDEGEARIKVILLERVNGFNSVFKAQKKGETSVVLEIPRVELLRFSHQIPSFRLTDEKGGSLRGFWELDPAALPLGFFP